MAQDRHNLPKRPWRLSLRRMFLVMTVFAVGLALTLNGVWSAVDMQSVYTPLALLPLGMALLGAAIPILKSFRAALYGFLIYYPLAILAVIAGLLWFLP